MHGLGSRTFWLPRRGNSPEEYEDAFALDDASGRYAVADGATEGCFTGLWARLLVEDFVSRGAGRQPMAVLASRRPGAMGRRRSRPEAGLGRRLLGRAGCVCRLPGTRAANSPRPWERRREPEGSQPLASRGRGRHLPVSHPRQCSAARLSAWIAPMQFGNRPQLVGSRMPADDVRQRQRLWTDGRGQPGDRLWVMTDALAKWCLAEHEAGGNPWANWNRCSISLPVPGPGVRASAPLSHRERGRR